MNKTQVVARLITEADNAGETAPIKTAESIMRFLDQAERREIAGLGDPFMALTTLIQYADFTIGPEGMFHHPTMPSAVAAAKGAMRSLYRGLRGLEFDPAKPGPTISFGGDFPDGDRDALGQAIVAALASVGFIKDGVQPVVSPALGTAMAKAQQALASWEAVEALRLQEGDSVEILCDNPDGPCAVVCSGDWTGFTEVRFEGDNVHAALKAAAMARVTGEMPEKPAEPAPDPVLVAAGLMEQYEDWIKRLRLRTMMRMTPEGKAGQRFIDGEDSVASEVILQLLHAIEALIRRSGAKTCVVLTVPGQKAVTWLRSEGLDYIPREQ